MAHQEDGRVRMFEIIVKFSSSQPDTTYIVSANTATYAVRTVTDDLDDQGHNDIYQIIVNEKPNTRYLG